MTKALVLGSTGMLGSAVLSALQSRGIAAIESSRTSGIFLDAMSPNIEFVLDESQLGTGDYVVNCVGLTKPRISEGIKTDLELAVRLNVLFPMELESYASRLGLKVIQVATDCVFRGNTGGYRESSPHDATDTYGKTKSLGEIFSDHFMHLRCSLIGPELHSQSLLFEWLRNQPKDARIQGYANHFWNGLTSSAFGRIVAGIISNNRFVSGTQHLVPADTVSKEDLVRMVLHAIGREDVQVDSHMTSPSIDRTLKTENEDVNLGLFHLGGYDAIPNIHEMVAGLC